MHKREKENQNRARASDRQLENSLNPLSENAIKAAESSTAGMTHVADCVSRDGGDNGVACVVR
jgi:hypothetical protein